MKLHDRQFKAIVRLIQKSKVEEANIVFKAARRDSAHKAAKNLKSQRQHHIEQVLESLIGELEYEKMSPIKGDAFKDQRTFVRITNTTLDLAIQIIQSELEDQE